ncbi:collagen alpha-1(I) chain-like [Muntiacus reevesi]|uniref:collagen alpha-1(I) chain-like n=1 Tax=Muntiacus reevesi TaxID=9886 RepID=UPI003306F55F
MSLSRSPGRRTDEHACKTPPPVSARPRPARRAGSRSAAGAPARRGRLRLNLPSRQSPPSSLPSFSPSFLPSPLGRRKESPKCQQPAPPLRSLGRRPAARPLRRPPPAPTHAARPPPPLPDDGRPAAAAAAAVAGRSPPSPPPPTLTLRTPVPSRGRAPGGARGVRRRRLRCKVKRAPNAKGGRKKHRAEATYRAEGPRFPPLCSPERSVRPPRTPRLHPEPPKVETFTGDVSAETLLRRAETAPGGAPLASSPPPHLQPASGRPPAPGPLAPRAAVSSRPPPGDRGGRRARRGGPSPSGRGGSSQQQQQQQRRPLTWKVTAEKKEEEEDGEKEEEEEGEEEGEETPLVPLFSLPRRPLLAKAERVWWGVSGSISLRTEGGRGPPGSRGSREARAAAVCVREPQRPPPLPVCGRTGLFLAAPPRTEVTRRSARPGRAGGRGGEREGGRGRDSASDVIGSPSASQGGRLNQKNQSGAGERRGLSGSRGDGAGKRPRGQGRAPARPLRAGRPRPRSRSLGSGISPGGLVSTCARNAPAAFPEVTHQGALGAPSSGNAARPAGVFKSAGAAARGAAAGFLVGRAGTWGERPPPACPSPFLGRDATEITCSSGRAGPGGGGIPGEQAPGRWASSPARRHPGGHRGSLEPLACPCGLVYTLEGEVPGRPRRPESRERPSGRADAPSASSGWSPDPPGTARRPSWAPERPSGAGCPGAAGPSRPPHPAAAPPPCPGRSKQETRKI